MVADDMRWAISLSLYSSVLCSLLILSEGQSEQMSVMCCVVEQLAYRMYAAPWSVRVPTCVFMRGSIVVSFAVKLCLDVFIILMNR